MKKTTYGSRLLKAPVGACLLETLEVFTETALFVENAHRFVGGIVGVLGVVGMLLRCLENATVRV